MHYLKRTPKEGLILRPDSARGIQCFVDADFANGWSVKTLMTLQLSILGQDL